MAEDARTQFVDGLRVSAEHLQHLQDRLRESVLDVRNAIGLGRVAWGSARRSEDLRRHHRWRGVRVRRCAIGGDNPLSVAVA